MFILVTLVLEPLIYLPSFLRVNHFAHNRITPLAFTIFPSSLLHYRLPILLPLLPLFRLFLPLLLIKPHLPLNIPTQNNMFQQQLILRQHPLLQLGELLLILFLQGIDLIHKVQFLQVKGLLVILLRQEDKLLVLVVLVVRDVCLDELVQRVDVLTGERDLVVCAVALVALLLLFLYGFVQLLQVDHLRRGEVLVLHVADQL